MRARTRSLPTSAITASMAGESLPQTGDGNVRRQAYSAANICDCRCNGRCQANFDVTTCATSAVDAMPPVVTRDGAGAWTTALSQARHAYFGRIVFFTRTTAGTTSSASLDVSPIRWSFEPQHGHAVLSGSITSSQRGRCAGRAPMFRSADFDVVARAVAAGECERGILICGTGIGISISANKVKGIRAALCGDCYSAEMTRRHNDANILAMGARVLGPGLALKIGHVPQHRV